ncbi:hypothetical protein AB6A40_004674 [Gnathostoma spinigerum]|uniref:Cation/H+ exchanger transmembrane domain-containing protein n=1 Tax=Gnathostoma spinigerum TaxID=75299 RepID=A0ABD6EEB8_9BILA
MALGSETVIFVFLGLSTVSSEHHWNSMFIILTVVMCIIYRVLGVTFLCYFLNKRRLRKYSKADQFIISYGGLRGAIAYGLVAALPDELPEKRLFVTACIVVIYWTVFFQGLTLRPIANFLKLERKEEHMKNMSEYTYQNLIDYTMSGMEEIAGIKGHHYVRHAYESFNKRFLKSILVKSRARKQMDNTNLVRAYRRIRRREAEDRLKKFDEPVDTLAQALMLHRGQYWSPAAQMAYYKHQAIPKGIQTQNDLQRSTEGDDVLSSESATELDDIGINESNVGHEEPQQIPVPKLSRTSQNSEL